MNFNGMVTSYSDLVIPETIYLPAYTLSPEQIFRGNILLFNVDFFGVGRPTEIKEATKDGNIAYYYYEDKNGQNLDTNGDGNYDTTGYKTSKQDIAVDLGETISKWYVSIRNIALVVMMIVLLYIGIRMLLSTLASDKAKYRQMIQDWLVGLMLLFLMHYIMAFAVTIVENLTDIVGSSMENQSYYAVIPISKDAAKAEQFKNGIEEAGLSNTFIDENKKQTTKDKAAAILYPTDLLGYLRIDIQLTGWGAEYIGKAICYVVLVFMTLFFVFTYLKRVLYMAFLTLIAPVVAVTYPIDKINDGGAQGFSKWFREYIFNLLIQPMHLLLYYILITSAFELASKNLIYSIVAIGFMIPAEKLLRNLFGFEKASTTSPVNGVAGAALAMGGISKLASLGRRAESSGGGKTRTVSDNSDSKDGPSFVPINMSDDEDDKTDEVSAMAEAAGEDAENQRIGEEIDGDQEALDQLRQEATTPQQRADLDEEQAEIDSRRAELEANTTRRTTRRASDDKAETAKYSPSAMEEENKKKISGKRVIGEAHLALSGHKKQMAKAARMATKGISVAAGVGLAAGAAAIGAAAGIAAGDPSDVLRNIGAGAGAGYLAGRGLTNVDGSMNQFVDNTRNQDKAEYYQKLATNGSEEDKAYAKEKYAKLKSKEYEEALKNNNFDKDEIKRMKEDGTINRYILNDVDAQDAATAELMRKDDKSITQEQAIADAKYAKRVGDKSDGPDRKKWEEHFADEFQDKTGMSEDKAKQAGKQAMKRVDRFNKYKKRTF